MPIRLRGFLGTLWMLNFVLLGLLVVPISDGTALMVALSLWAVPTCFLLLLSWRYWHHRHEDDRGHPSAQGGAARH